MMFSPKSLFIAFVLFAVGCGSNALPYGDASNTGTLPPATSKTEPNYSAIVSCSPACGPTGGGGAVSGPLDYVEEWAVEQVGDFAEDIGASRTDFWTIAERQLVGWNASSDSTNFGISYEGQSVIVTIERPATP